MTTIKVYLPESEIASFRQFASKMKRNIPDLSYEIGEPYRKIFSHSCLTEKHVCHENQWHIVCDTVINLPDDSGWRLLATLKDGVYIITDKSKELVLKNPEHGKEYGRCDVCGHACKNSYIVYNESTGEELQVGCECVKKFGLKYMNFLAKFTAELYRSFNYCDISTDAEDGMFPRWPSGKPDKSASRTIKVSELICAAKAYYDIQPKWQGGYYEGRVYYQSRSNQDIQLLIADKDYNFDEEYTKSVCEYIRQNINSDESDFCDEMVRIANNFYSEPASAVFGFFMVKKYEDNLKSKALNLDTFKKGMQVKVSGEIILNQTVRGYYGDYQEYSIKTSKGFMVFRRGAIPVTIEKEGNNTTSFYALIEYINLNKAEIHVGRALKNPKKGIEIIEL